MEITIILSLNDSAVNLFLAGLCMSEKFAVDITAWQKVIFRHSLKNSNLSKVS